MSLGKVGTGKTKEGNGGKLPPNASKDTEIGGAPTEAYLHGRSDWTRQKKERLRKKF